MVEYIYKIFELMYLHPFLTIIFIIVIGGCVPSIKITHKTKKEQED